MKRFARDVAKSMSTGFRGRLRAPARRLLRAAHPALAGQLRRLVRPSRHPQPDLVTVVVPFYQVEAYFAACLDSIVTQTYRNLQIVLVDDGSRDSSLRIARGYARWDRRIRIIRQDNAGLGAARNTGVAAARGRYLMFVDSDDLLPRDATSVLVRSLQRTGSDFAVGAIHRIDEDGRREIPTWVRHVHRDQRLGIGLDDFPSVLTHVFAWGKLFDREFFLRRVASFPVGIRYEDQEVSARAFLRGRFDVLADMVYGWRRRGEGTSITQQKSDPRDLADRLEVTAAVARLMTNEASPLVANSWLAKAIGFDLRPYYEQVPRTGPEFWVQLRAGVLRFADGVSDEVWRTVSLIDRYPALCVRDDHRNDLIVFLTRRAIYGLRVAVEVGSDAVRLGPEEMAALSYHPSPDLLELAPTDLQLTTRLWDWTWSDGGLDLSGYALVLHLPADENQSDIELAACATGTDGSPVRVQLAVQQRVDDRIDAESTDAWSTYRGSAFTARLASADLLRAPVAATAWWRIEVVVRSGPIERRGRLARPERRGRAAVDLVTPDDGRGRWLVELHRSQGVRLRYRPRRAELVALVDVAREGGGEIVVTHVPGRSDLVTAVTRRPRRAASASVGETETTLTLPAVRSGAATWVLETTDGEAVADPRARPSGRSADLVALYQTRTGSVRIRQSPSTAVAVDVAIAGGELTITLRSLPESTNLSARLVNDRASLPTTVERNGETVRIRADLTTSLIDVASPYAVLVSLAAGAEERVPVAPELLRRLPLSLDAEPIAGVAGLNRDQGLQLQLRVPLRPDERSRLGQRVLQQTFLRRSELRDAVLFESFDGRMVADSPLALCRELLLRGDSRPMYWTVDNLTRAVPTGATALLRHSQRWMEVLHRARYLVNANNFPHYFRKQAGQRYLQTWHGTPLKKIGKHVPGASLSLPYRSLMTREPGYWDLLLAQSPFAAQVLPDAFDYRGEVLSTGYPRDDALSQVTEQERTELRARWGLGPDDLAILYAPTWRDSVSTSRGYGLVSYLEPAMVRQRFGPSATVLLRGHANTLGDRAEPEPGLIDVSTYPDINDLFIAADVLVTDYSSVMFDFCITGKPMLFLTPDLADYRDKTRGFYFDFEAQAPGPLCMTSAEVVTALADLEGVRQRYAAAYTAFRERYAPNDDGHAAGRVVDAFWG